jgi:uncharacterized paraquat-inducible protein A
VLPELSLGEKWCPKCAAFQSSGNSICESCGAPMASASRQMSWPAKCVAGLVVLFFSAVFIAIFHGIGILILLVIGGIVAIGAFKQSSKKSKLAAMNPLECRQYELLKQVASERKALRCEQWAYGPINQSLICPHCQTKGKVRAKQIEVKVGVSGGKATAAVLTGGISLLAAGLSRKQRVTAARCGECGSSWQF